MPRLPQRLAPFSLVTPARLGGAGAFALRLDGNFVQHGRERVRVVVSPAVGGRITAELTTSNNIY